MTAHGRSSLTTSWGILSLEVQSVNRRHLEVNSSLPKEFLSFDPEIKKKVQKKVFRGKVNLYLTFTLNGQEEVFSLSPNLSLAREIKKGWDVISSDLGIEQSHLGLTKLLCRDSSLLQAELKNSFVTSAKNEIMQLVDETLNLLVTMRAQEGEFLKKDFTSRIRNLEKLLKEVEENASGAAVERQNKLKARIGELLDQELAVDERLLKEIAILADKSDITEEFTRIQSHLELFEKVLNNENQNVGKTLDFITQELNREWNTIGSKCSDSKTSHLVIQAKSECEKIREQVQNVE
ncbi:MAG: hypothetical protein S4CHLAM6_08710 [Chlamydiae bacterium]|nr:hypothetical protein [Chlamydiota bacterium]